MRTIERPLWRELLKVLEPTTATELLKPRYEIHSRYDWVWMPEADTFGVRARGLFARSESPPDRCVFVGNLSDLPSYPRFQPIDPRQHEGVWLVDEDVILDLEGIQATEGYLILVNAEDQPISEPVRVYLPANQPFYFFRLGRDGVAVLTDTTQVTNDGNWVIAVAPSASLLTSTGSELLADRQYAVPTPLESAGAIAAGLFRITLPLQLQVDQRLYIELLPRLGRIAATIVDATTVNGLAMSAPVYEADALNLLIENARQQMIERLSLRVIAPNRRPRTIGLADFQAEALACADSNNGSISVPLIPLLNPDGGEHRLMLYRGMTPLLSEPLVFYMLPPGVKIDSPLTNVYFTESQPPSAFIHGVRVEQLEVGVGAIVQAEVNGGVRITWTSPRAPCHAILHLDNQDIPLAWTAQWSYAWIEPVSPDETLWKNEIRDASIHVRGAPQEMWTFSVGESRRVIHLNAQGSYNSLLRLDPLSDMLRDYAGAYVSVTASNATETYKLFEYIQPDYLPLEAKPPIVKAAIGAARLLVRSGRQRHDNIRASALIAAPPVDEGINYGETQLSLASPLFAALSQARQTSISVLIGKLLPEHLRLKLIITDDAEPLFVDSDQFDGSGGTGTITLHLRGYENDMTYTIRARWSMLLHNATGELFLDANNEDIRLCPECHELFLWSSVADRIRHGHGQGLKIRPLIVSPTEPIQIQRIEWNAREALVKYTSKSSIADQSVVNSYRLRTEPYRLYEIAEQNVPPFSVDAFRAACAGWVYRYRGSEVYRSKIEHIVSEETHRLWMRYCSRIVEGIGRFESPALIGVARILEMFSDDWRDWYSALAPIILTLAFICRAQAYESTELTSLDIPVDEMQFSALLSDAYDACPQLLLWALRWVEVCFHYLHVPSTASS